MSYPEYKNVKTIDGVNIYEEITSLNGQVVILNENRNVVDKIVNRIKINNGHCPCQIQKAKETICPCVELKNTGICYCQLYKPIDKKII